MLGRCAPPVLIDGVKAATAMRLSEDATLRSAEQALPRWDDECVRHESSPLSLPTEKLETLDPYGITSERFQHVLWAVLRVFVRPNNRRRREHGSRHQRSKTFILTTRTIRPLGSELVANVRTWCSKIYIDSIFSCITASWQISVDCFYVAVFPTLSKIYKLVGLPIFSIVGTNTGHNFHQWTRTARRQNRRTRDKQSIDNFVFSRCDVLGPGR